MVVHQDIIEKMDQSEREFDSVMLRQQMMKLELAIDNIQTEITRMSRKINTIEQAVK